MWKELVLLVFDFMIEKRKFYTMDFMSSEKLHNWGSEFVRIVIVGSLYYIFGQTTFFVCLFWGHTQQ